MVPRQQVIDYISSNVRSGYDLPSIRSRLLASGYEPGEINAAIDVVRSGKTSVEPKKNIGIFVVIAIAMVGFLLIAGTAIVFFQNSSDLPTNPSIGSSTFDKPTTTKETTKTTTPSTTKQPSTTPTTSKTSDSTTTPSTGSSNFKGTNNVRDTIPSVDYASGNSQTTLTTRLAIESKVNQLVSSDPDAAANLCKQINTVVGQNSCYNNVAQASEQSKFCMLIGDVDSADACLTSLVIKGAETVELCKQITSEIRFRQCVQNYDLRTQTETLQKSATEVAAHALSDAPALPTDQEIVDAYSVPFQESPVDAVTVPTTTDSEVPTDSVVEPTAPECVTEGNTIPVIQNPPTCCEGLQLINPATENIVGISGICTAQCGNQVCDAQTESNYNCPADCPSQTQETS